MLLVVGWAGLAVAAAQAQTFTNLNDAYASVGFDPNAPGNAVVIVFSNPHMRLDGPQSNWTTNLNPLLVNLVNTMQPPAAKIIVTGDLITDLSPQMGVGGPTCPPCLELGTNEMLVWGQAIQAFSDSVRSNLVWVLGNHDQGPDETNAETFHAMFPDMPLYQTFDIAGSRFFLLNAGNCGEPSPDERAWFQQQIAMTPPTQEVVLVQHYVAFGSPVMYRGMQEMTRPLLANWQAHIWGFSGHTTTELQLVCNVGQMGAAACVAGQETIHDGLIHDTGFEILCLGSHGISTVFYYHFDTATIDAIAESQGFPFSSTGWNVRAPAVLQFEATPGLLWRRSKTRQVVPPEVVAVDAFDVGDWFGFPLNLDLRLQLGLHANQATHLLLAVAGVGPDCTVQFSPDYTNWISTPFQTRLVGVDGVAAIPIPPEIAKLPVAYARFTGDYVNNNDVGGWGLSTTNAGPLVTFPQIAPIADQEAAPGAPFRFRIPVIDPYAPPDPLTFSLISGPPGATIDPNSGIFSWQPTFADAGRTFSVTVRVADNGLPTMSATQRFSVTVDSSGLPVLSLGEAGSPGSLPPLFISGPDGATYTIWVSSDLVSWSILSTTNPATLPFQFQDATPSGDGNRFYRVSVEH